MGASRLGYWVQANEYVTPCRSSRPLTSAHIAEGVFRFYSATTVLFGLRPLAMPLLRTGDSYAGCVWHTLLAVYAHCSNAGKIFWILD